MLKHLLPICLILMSLNMPAPAQTEVSKKSKLSLKSHKQASVNADKKNKAAKNKKGKSYEKRFAHKKDAIQYLHLRGIGQEQYDDELINHLETGDTKTAAALVAAGARINRSGDEKKPFLLAAQYGDVELLQFMVKRGADINIVDKQPEKGAVGMGRTAQFYAVKADKLDNLKYLNTLGLSYNATSKDEARYDNVIRHAASHGSMKCTLFLLSTGIDPHETFQGGRNLLFCAAGSGNLKLVKHLIRLKVQPRLATGIGHSTLTWAAVMKQDHIVRYLIELGCNLNEDLQRVGMHPAHHIATHCSANTLRLFHQKGGDITVVDNRGRSPLHYAADGGQFESVEYLIQQGLRINDIDKIDIWDNKKATPKMRELVRRLQAE